MEEPYDRMTQAIADTLKDYMMQNGISARQILLTGHIQKAALYSVLRMGKIPNDNYTIKSLLKVLAVLRINIRFDVPEWEDRNPEEKE